MLNTNHTIYSTNHFIRFLLFGLFYTTRKTLEVWKTVKPAQLNVLTSSTTRLLRISNFMGPGYYAALLFPGLGSLYNVLLVHVRAMLNDV